MLKTEPNAEAFIKQAMKNWGDVVYRLALSQTRSHSDAEDVYQEVFLQLFNNEKSFENDEHVKAWLLRVTVNRCRDIARSSWKKRQVTLDTEWDTLEDRPLEKHDSEIWDAVNQLPDQQRLAIHLYYVEGYSTAEIAQLLKCKDATARTWLFRGRASIKKLLEAGKKEPRRESESSVYHSVEVSGAQALNAASFIEKTTRPLPSILP